MVNLDAVKGPKSDTIEYIGCLFDPSKPQPRITKGKQIVPSHPVIGYKIKVLEDTLVPDSIYRPNAKEYDEVELPIHQVLVPAGTIVTCTTMDMILLISKEEYAGYFTGGDFPVRLSRLKLKNYPQPRPTIRGVDKTLGSIKVNGEFVATGYSKNWVVLEEYERKFGGLFANKKPKHTTENNVTPSAHAEAVRQLYANTLV